MVPIAHRTSIIYIAFTAACASITAPRTDLWGLEADSPRGRIRQMVLVDEGRLALGDSFVRHIDQCLDCRACETACPSGVEYGKLVEGARAQIEQNYRRPLSSRIARSLVYRHLLPYPRPHRRAWRASRVFISALVCKPWPAHRACCGCSAWPTAKN